MRALHSCCFFAGVMALLGCGAKTGLPVPGGPVTQPKDIRSTKETCFIHCTGQDGPFDKNIAVCLPVELNPFVGNQLQITNKYGPAPGNAQYNTDTAVYCATVADQVQQWTGFEITGMVTHCAANNDPKAITCTGTQIANSLIENNDCKVFPPPNTTDDECGFNNCDFTQVFDSQTKTIKASYCNCTICQKHVGSGCCASVLTPNNPPKVFRPEAGGVDPIGLQGGFLEAEITGAVDSTNNNSSSTATLTVTDNFNNTHSDTRTAALHGELHLYGRPNNDGSGVFRLDAGMTADDIAFHITNFDFLVNFDVHVKDATMSLGMGTNTVSINANGDGVIGKGGLTIHMEAIVEGTKTVVDTTNSMNIVNVHANFGAKTFSISNFPFAVAGVTGSAHVSGMLVNQPPVADAGSDQTVECTNPSSGAVTLHGSVLDPDNNVRRTGWEIGTTFWDPSKFVAASPLAAIAAPFFPPFATTAYTLFAEDAALQVHANTTHVKVQDTTAPTLILATPQPECLWAPNHKMVLYDLGKDLPFTVADVCDANATVEILEVKSNQPDLGGGQGNFIPDFLSGKKGLCLRSERQGTVMWDREYTVQISAIDVSKNQTIKAVVVRVPHDQSGAAKCPKIDPTRFVDETDPRCTAN